VHLFRSSQICKCGEYSAKRGSSPF
jgi:hypothetical protein